MRKQWRCFHCDELFISFKCAQSHFGSDETKEVACRLKGHEQHLVDYIRDLEAQLDSYRADDSHVMRSIYTLEADHRQALIRAEEAGYNKGVRDMTPAPLAWDANSNRSYEPVEVRAAEIYASFEYDGPGQKPAWTPGGNGLKQDEARFLARADIRASSAVPSEKL